MVDWKYIYGFILLLKFLCLIYFLGENKVHEIARRNGKENDLKATTVSVNRKRM